MSDHRCSSCGRDLPPAKCPKCFPSSSEAVWQPCEPPEGHIVSQIPGNPIYTYQGDGADARWYRLETPRFTAPEGKE